GLPCRRFRWSFGRQARTRPGSMGGRCGPCGSRHSRVPEPSQNSHNQNSRGCIVTMNDLPLLGAAMTVADLEQLQDFILNEHRDLELQDFCVQGALDRDWRPAAERARVLLSGYLG